MTPGVRFAVILGLYVAVWLNALAPLGLRFTIPILNYAVFLGGQFLPFVLAVMAAAVWRGWRRAGLLALAVPLLLLSLPMGLGAAGCTAMVAAHGGTDPSFERVRVTPSPRGRVATYRTNGGATTAFGIVVRQECAVIPGVLVTANRLASGYPAHDADVVVGSTDRVEILLRGDEDRRVTAKLRRWPCVA